MWVSNTLPYRELGLRVFPCEAGGKRPLIKRGYHAASLDPDIIRVWQQQHPDANIGLACAPNGITAVDVDPRNSGHETFAKLLRQLGPLPDTWESNTGSGGEHRVFRSPAGATAIGQLGPGVDVKHAGYIIVAPSVHPSGASYVWKVGKAPWETSLGDFPSAWAQAIFRRGSTDTARREPVGSVAESFVAELFRAMGSLGSAVGTGTLAVVCPWISEHGFHDGRCSGAGSDSSTVILAPTTRDMRGAFKCLHSSCEHRSLLDVVDVAPAGALMAAAMRYPQAFRNVVRRDLARKRL